MPLNPKADKATQIAYINELEKKVQALLDYANGNDDALAVLNNSISEARTTLAAALIEPEAAAVSMPAPLGVPSTPKSKPVVADVRGPIPDEYKCKCGMAVKDKDSATQLCLLCGKNAYESHYVFAHTEAGIALRTGKVPTYIPADNIIFTDSSDEVADEDWQE